MNAKVSGSSTIGGGKNVKVSVGKGGSDHCIKEEEKDADWKRTNSRREELMFVNCLWK